MKSDQKQKAADEARITEAKAVEKARIEAEKVISERLSNLKNFLLKQSLFNGDNQFWAAGCIQSFLDGNEKTLDHAFGLRSSKTGRKPMQSGAHDDWVVAAFVKVFDATPVDRVWPDTETMATIGRYFGLGGKDSANAESHGIASELKRILTRYKPIIVQQLSDELSQQLSDNGCNKEQ